MQIEFPFRIVVAENRLHPGALRIASEATGLSAAEIELHISRAGQRLQRELRLTESPLQVNSGGVLVEGIAGMIRVSPHLELEVIPKFLSGESATWREDFFLLSTLSRYGYLLPREHLGASVGHRGDLATLVGRAFVDLFDQNRRRPLRTYRLLAWTEMALDGDADEEDLALPGPDGIPQQGLRLTVENEYNARISRAAELLLLEVADVETRRRLGRVCRAFGQQPASMDVVARRRFPSRHRSWEALHDLAGDIVNGLGISFAKLGGISAPGFVTRTDKLWEDVVYRCLRTGLVECKVHEQRGFPLGERAGTQVLTTPDVAAEYGEGYWALADAKYKGRIGEPVRQISAADLYEALAFLDASGSNRILLFYPQEAEDPRSMQFSTGDCREFDRVTTEADQFIGIKVEVHGVSGSGGLRRLSEGMSNCFRQYFNLR